MKTRKIAYLLYISFFRFTPEDYRPYSFFFPRLRAVLVQHFTNCTGANIRVKHNADISMNIEIGDRSEIGQRSLIHGNVEIGTDVIMGPDVKIYSRNHSFDKLAIPISFQGKTQKKTVIGNNVWIGANVIILPGVNVASGCVIGAGAVVSKSTVANGIYLGNPATLKKIRQ